MQQNELPEGWENVPLMEICSLIRGVSYKRGEEKDEANEDYVPLIRANNIQKVLQFEDLKYVPSKLVSSEKLLTIGDVIIALSSGSKKVVGKAVTLSKPWFGTFGAFCGVLRPNNYISWKYFGYYFQTSDYRDFISIKSSGVNINNLKREYFEQIYFPFPPPPEQHRIVTAIEALFARLDATNERLDRVPGIMKTFRQAVLAAACDGRLTEDWREENQTERDSWSDLDFFDFCVLQRGYDLPVSKRRDGPYPVMASSGLLAYHDEYKISGPGVVVGRSGSTGKVHYTDEDYWPHNTTLFVKDFKGNYPKYVYLFLVNFNLEQYSASTAVPTLNRNNLRGIIVSVPPLSEQREIVRRVDALFAFADSIEAKVAVAREKTERLRQSILAKAFSGELVPTEAELARQEGREYESAEVLLERIKAGGKSGKK